MKVLIALFVLCISVSAMSGDWKPQSEAELQKMLNEWEAGDYRAFKQYKKKGLDPNFEVDGGRTLFIKAVAGYVDLKYTKNHIKILDLLIDIGLDLNHMQVLGFPTTAITTTFNEDFLRWSVKNGGKLNLTYRTNDLVGDFTSLGATCRSLGWNDEANELVHKKLQFVKDELGYDLNENGLCSCRKFIPWEPEYVEEELLEKFPELEKANCN